MTKRRKKSQRIGQVNASIAQNEPQQARPASSQSGQLVTKSQYLVESYSGPLPPPEILARYEAITPGAADRIIAMAERQSAHRQELESSVIHGNLTAQRVGQRYGLIIGVLGISAAVILGVIGKELASSALGGGTVVSLVALFITGRLRQERERAERR